MKQKKGKKRNSLKVVFSRKGVEVNRNTMIDLDTLDKIFKLGPDELQKLVDEETEEFNTYIAFDTRPDELKPIGIFKVGLDEDAIAIASKQSRVKPDNLYIANVNILVPVIFSSVNLLLKMYRTGSVIQAAALVKMCELFISQFHSFVNRKGNTGYKDSIAKARVASFVRSGTTNIN